MKILPVHDSYFHEHGSPVSNLTTNLYLLYVCSFFLHLAERVPGIKVIRPDLLLVIIIGILLFAQSDRLKKRLTNSVSKMLLFLLVYIILTLPLVEWPGSILRVNASIFVKAIVFYFFTLFTIDTDTKLKKFVFVIILCQIFRVLEPLYLHFFFGYWGSSTYLGEGEFASRLSGAPYDIINPNGLAFVIATVFAFIHHLWWCGNWRAKSIYLVVCVFLFTALFLTLSRSGFAAMMVIVWNIFIKSKRKILIMLVVVVASTLIWGMMSDIQRDRYLSMTGSDETRSSASYLGRFHAMSIDLYVGMQRPIFGFGLGTSKEARGNISESYQLSHILYAEVLIELGIIGFVLYMNFIYQIYKSIRRSILNLRATEKLGLDSEASNQLKYERNLVEALNTCFWMYLIFSIAQYGLSEYHWYLLAGMTTLVNAMVRRQQNKKIDTHYTGNASEVVFPSGRL